MKVMMSSTRLRNSGRNVCFSMSMEALEVMMMMVFLKLTVRPLLSVSRPSSSTCSKVLNTSGCAFSISSKSTTE